jgi:hypothetical protein
VHPSKNRDSYFPQLYSQACGNHQVLKVKVQVYSYQWFTGNRYSEGRRLAHANHLIKGSPTIKHNQVKRPDYLPSRVGRLRKKVPFQDATSPQLWPDIYSKPRLKWETELPVSWPMTTYVRVLCGQAGVATFGQKLGSDSTLSIHASGEVL